MKNIILSAALFTVSFTTLAQVGIGTTSPEAALDVVSTNSGILIPRVADTSAIISLVNGMIIYDTSSNCLKAYENGVWTNCLSDVSDSSTAILTNDCDADGFVQTGAFVSGIPLVGASFSVTLTNNSFSTAIVSFASGDLVLSGVSGISVGMPTLTSVTLNSGETHKITYPLSGTPANVGTLSVVWTKLALNCTKTLSIVKGHALFVEIPNPDPIPSIGDGTIDIQGVVDNTAISFEVAIPYTAGYGNYDAYTSAVINSATGTGEAGDANGFSISYPSGTFSETGTILVKINVHGDASFNIKKQLFGVISTIASLDFQVNDVSEGALSLDAVGGIPDRNYADANHKFIYLPITNVATGETWLNNNLGSNYSNLNHAAYNPSSQATTITDIHAYGSNFQWGRYSDGHEFRSSGTTSTFSNTDDPGHGNFITGQHWRLPKNDDLWQGETGINNPCPMSYRLPTELEWETENTTGGINSAADAFNSDLKITLPGVRDDDGSFNNEGNYNHSWVSTVDNSLAKNYDARISSGVSITQNTRANGFSVRCIKD